MMADSKDDVLVCSETATSTRREDDALIIEETNPGRLVPLFFDSES